MPSDLKYLVVPRSDVTPFSYKLLTKQIILELQCADLDPESLNFLLHVPEALVFLVVVEFGEVDSACG